MSYLTIAEIDSAEASFREEWNELALSIGGKTYYYELRVHRDNTEEWYEYQNLTEEFTPLEDPSVSPALYRAFERATITPKQPKQ